MPHRINLAILSQSIPVAHGITDIVRDLVGDDVVCVHYGRCPSSTMGEMIIGIRETLQCLDIDNGVAVLVDIGATQAAAEAAIASLPLDARSRISICDAPIVKGAIVACSEALRGASLDEVCHRTRMLTRITNGIRLQCH